MQLADIEDVIKAAQRHGEHAGPGREVDDLRNALRLAWERMTSEARADFMTCNAIWECVSENSSHTFWEPAHNVERNMFCLMRPIGTGGAEVKRYKDGKAELFHTRFKAQRRANALNEED